MAGLFKKLHAIVAKSKKSGKTSQKKGEPATSPRDTPNNTEMVKTPPKQKKVKSVKVKSVSTGKGKASKVSKVSKAQVAVPDKTVKSGGKFSKKMYSAAACVTSSHNAFDRTWNT